MFAQHPVPDHLLTIEALFFPKEEIHKWRAVCTCGYVSPWDTSHVKADRASNAHRLERLNADPRR